ncbi:MAG: MBL fold metallo-hydrolase, partial [Lachnospiraceae bacterium]|nr:MBL fold metallo-hydrolase [Lachnospiraceae bacterium]
MEEGTLPILTVTILKVGKADAIMIQTEDKVMMIDTGEEDDKDKLAIFLKQENISKVDYLIITHFDKDHVGG